MNVDRSSMGIRVNFAMPTLGSKEERAERCLEKENKQKEGNNFKPVRIV